MRAAKLKNFLRTELGVANFNIIGLVSDVAVVSAN
jgi:hypothetical protein